jgi:hypothetical protein
MNKRDIYYPPLCIPTMRKTNPSNFTDLWIRFAFHFAYGSEIRKKLICHSAQDDEKLGIKKKLHQSTMMMIILLGKERMQIGLELLEVCICSDSNDDDRL